MFFKMRVYTRPDFISLNWYFWWLIWQSYLVDWPFCLYFGELTTHFIRDLAPYSGFSQTHKIGKNGIIASSIFPYIYSSLLYLHHIMLVGIKWDIRGCNRITILRLQTLLGQFLSDETAKTKLMILAFLYCGEFVKTLLLAVFLWTDSTNQNERCYDWQLNAWERAVLNFFHYL